jgi:DNA helicase HerA-like ATPase
MNKWLQISKELLLPIELVTSTQAILAKRGVGKTHTASVVAEEMLHNKLPIIAIDPTGAWYGLKSSKDGKHAGYPVAVFGGEHADIPLEDTAGETIASAIVKHRFSAIIDISLLRKGQWYKFLAPFLETLYLQNREPVHLFVDEAHKLAPQKPMGGDLNEFRVIGAMEDIVQMGRRKGIGCTVISQRPAVLNKNVLTQCELLCVMRMIHNLDIKAVKEWVDVHGDKDKASQMISELPSLPKGTAWFWSPGMRPEIFGKAMVRDRETFDSSATPELGKKARSPKVLAQIDLEKLGEQIKGNYIHESLTLSEQSD